jgi:hypothetical protein
VVSEAAPEAGNSHGPSAFEARSALFYHFRHRSTFLETPHTAQRIVAKHQRSTPLFLFRKAKQPEGVSDNV